MKENPYNLAMFFIVISFVPLISILRNLEQNFFLTQLSVILILLVFSAVTLFMISRKMNMAWSFSVILFSLHLMNVVYLFLIEKEYNLILYTLIALLGFIVSIYHVDEKFRKQISTKIKILKKPKKANVKKSSSKKVNKTSKKSKKTAKKKTAKRVKKKTRK